VKARLVSAELRQRLTRVGTAIVTVLAIGTTGYVLIEQWTPLEALYMTVTTISTVGYGEIRPLSDAGRYFTMFIILSGTGVLAFLLGTIGELTGAIRRRRVQTSIDQLKGHFIICGHGRVGHEIVEDLRDNDVAIVIIDRTPEPLRHGDRYHFIEGDASDDAVLQRAGVTRARGLVAATGDDNANIVVTLTARALNPSLVIVARASHPSAEAKLMRAGASHAISPYRIGGRRMATQLLHPKVTDFLDRLMHSRDLEFWLEEATVHSGSKLAGRTIAECAIARDTGVNLLAVVKGAGGALLTNPPADTRLDSSDVLIGFGTRRQLEQLGKLAGDN
jgi:voltage-gated potassium channel